MPSTIIRFTVGTVLASALVCALLSTTACSDHRTSAEQAAAQQAEIRGQIVKSVTDPARADQVLGLLKQWETQVAELQKTDAGFTRRLDALNADYAAAKDAFTTLYAERQASDTAFIRQTVELRAELVAATSPAEWEQLAKIRTELRSSAVTPVQGATP